MYTLRLQNYTTDQINAEVTYEDKQLALNHARSWFAQDLAPLRITLHETVDGSLIEIDDLFGELKTVFTCTNDVDFAAFEDGRPLLLRSREGQQISAIRLFNCSGSGVYVVRRRDGSIYSLPRSSFTA